MFIASACECGPKTMRPDGELRLMPSPLDFGEACVKPTSSAFTVRPVTKMLNLQNGGLVALDLDALVLDGGPGFSVPGDWPRTLGSSESYALPISFLPEKTGAVTASLSFIDGKGAQSTVELSGSGAITPPDPVVALHCPGGRSGPTAELCWDTANMLPRPNPLMWLPDTVVGASSKLDLIVGNQGCADLEVGSVALDGGGGVFTVSTTDAFTVQGRGAADAGTQTLRVTFSPTAAGAAMGTLALATNTSTVAVRLLGSGVMPSLQLCTGAQCATPAVPVRCDFSATQPCTGAFTVRNSGSSALMLDGISLLQGNPHFVLTGAPATFPATLQPSGMSGDSLSLNVQFAATIAYDSDVLEVRSSGGTLKAQLQGGQPPQLTLVPASLDFGTHATGYDSTQSFELRNTGTGPLTVRSVAFAQTGGATWPAGGSVFTVTAPDAGSVVMPGASLTVPVRFVDPPEGGPSGSLEFAADLKLDTNDPRFETFGGTLLTVSGKTPCNPAPVADATGATSASKATTVSFDGSKSYDVKPDGAGSCRPGVKSAVSKYEWSLLSVPANAGAGVMLSSTSGSTTQLTLGTCAPCSYVVRLYVYDDTPGGGRKSSPTDLTVNAQ